MTFKERLRSLRQTKKVTQKHIAESTNMCVETYQRYEYGTRDPAFRKLIALADYFDVSIDYLVGRTDDPRVHKK